jgi:hypothetical protein
LQILDFLLLFKHELPLSLIFIFQFLDHLEIVIELTLEIPRNELKLGDDGLALGFLSTNHVHLGPGTF